MKITGRHVDCLNRDSIPEENEDISEVIKMDVARNEMEYFDIYFRDPIDCPLARGNWMVDVTFKGDTILAIKLPKEMTEEAVYKYCKPLMELVIC